MTGPLLGNALAGWTASFRSLRFSISGGGVVWVAAVLACIPFLPAFWRYDRSARNTPDSERLRGRSPGHPPRAFREDSANKGRCFAVNRR